MRIVAQTAGQAELQWLEGIFPGHWSRAAHLWWTGARPGDALTLSVPVEKAGLYRLTVQLTKADAYGIVQPYLDQQNLGEAIDLYHSPPVPSGQIDLGKHRLDQGDHRLKFEIVGANPQAKQDYMFGLDYVLLRDIE